MFFAAEIMTKRLGLAAWMHYIECKWDNSVDNGIELLFFIAYISYSHIYTHGRSRGATPRTHEMFRQNESPQPSSPNWSLQRVTIYLYHSLIGTGSSTVPEVARQRWRVHRYLVSKCHLTSALLSFSTFSGVISSSNQNKTLFPFLDDGKTSSSLPL
jgi:hypothetical protein